MNIRLKLPVLMLLLPMPATSLAGSETTCRIQEFDNTLFNVPKGWSKLRRTGQ